MSMNDTIYSGVEVFDDTPAPRPRAFEKQRQQQTERAKSLTPAAEVIADIIAHEKASLSDFHSYMKSCGSGVAVTAEDMKAEYRARELHFSFLNRLDETIQRVLREKEAGDGPDY